ncbi:GGDEF domain-containing protein [Deinococcus ruber]|uniref:GGDEF domain-containing protein n=1 Tax=Deinococcus ruber TaxID=1848197 RepID=A0A918CH60_9DEIO|nr:GGDEF domain-containing protein [Deinococcus ruber]GGR23541.1 hypothetical protein GCM10008957_39270 [Deinococcus ruber]
MQISRTQLAQLTQADTREALVGALLHSRTGLRRATLWWQDDDVTIPLVQIGRGREGTPVPLTLAPRYLLSVTPGAVILPELLSVLELKLAYLDLRQQLSDLKPQHQTLATAAYTDGLTGLLNRRALDRDLEALEAADTSFGVIFIDLDGFKSFNDRHGHALGDSLLRGYGRWISRQLGTLGTVYRLGGDEYVGVITSAVLTPAEFYRWVHDRVQPQFIDGVRVSFGMAWRDEHPRVSELLRLADARMYQAKMARRTTRLADAPA